MLPKAQRFDIKKELADTSNPLPNSLCSAEQFTQVMQEAGVNHDSLVVIYEDAGLFSAARAWWMFKAMGFNNVKVLGGGLAKWLELGLAVESNYTQASLKGDFIAHYQPDYFIDKKQVLSATKDANTVILDARAYERFTGKNKEPRAGMRSGHIINSYSLPLSSLLENGEAKSLDFIQTQFSELVGNATQIQFSCGSGVRRRGDDPDDLVVAGDGREFRTAADRAPGLAGGDRGDRAAGAGDGPDGLSLLPREEGGAGARSWKPS